MYTNCPTGHQSWCGYQRDIATRTSIYKPVTQSLSEAIVKLVTPIFIQLANEAFLEGCKNVSNQNANDSFNILYGVSATKSNSIINRLQLI